MKDKEEPMYCGSQNVKVRSQKVSLILKQQGIGDIAYKGGWRISYYDIMPQSHWRMTQSMSIKEIGCDASQMLWNPFGLDCISESRAD